MAKSIGCTWPDNNSYCLNRGRRILSITTISGYLAGFILGMVLNTDGIDPGGGRTNNA